MQDLKATTAYGRMIDLSSLLEPLLYSRFIQLPPVVVSSWFGLFSSHSRYQSLIRTVTIVNVECQEHITSSNGMNALSGQALGMM